MYYVIAFMRYFFINHHKKLFLFDLQFNRHEFLSQYLGGGAILMKAKRSITNSFDHLIKRKGRDGVGPLMRETSLPQNSTTFHNVSLY